MNNEFSKTTTGIKTLRSLNQPSKPLHVKLMSKLDDAIAFLGRMVTCNNELQLAPNTVSRKDVRCVMNEFGKWVPAKE